MYVKTLRFIMSVIVAIIFPSLLFILWVLLVDASVNDLSNTYFWKEIGSLFMISIFVSGAYVLILGLPSYCLMQWLGAIRWWSIAILGFILASIPLGILTWPLDLSGGYSASYNGIQTVIDGIPTLEGWLKFLYGTSLFGALGAVSAMAFWAVWKNKTHNCQCHKGLGSE